MKQAKYCRDIKIPQNNEWIFFMQNMEEETQLLRMKALLLSTSFKLDLCGHSWAHFGENNNNNNFHLFSAKSFQCLYIQL